MFGALIMHNCRAPAMRASYSWPPTIMFYRCSLDLLSFIFSPPNLRDRLAPIVTKLCHMIDGDPDL